MCYYRRNIEKMLQKIETPEVKITTEMLRKYFVDYRSMRTKLLGFLLKLKISTSTKLKTGKMLEGMTEEQAEKKASQILTLLTSCKTESDVLTRLSIQ